MLGDITRSDVIWWCVAVIGWTLLITMMVVERKLNRDLKQNNAELREELRKNNATLDRGVASRHLHMTELLAVVDALTGALPPEKRGEVMRLAGEAHKAYEMHEKLLADDPGATAALAELQAAADNESTAVAK